MSDPISSANTNSSKIGDLSNVKNSKSDTGKIKRALVITGLVLIILAGIAMVASGSAFMSLGIVGAGVVPLLTVGSTVIVIGLIASVAAFMKMRNQKSEDSSSKESTKPQPPVSQANNKQILRLNRKGFPISFS